MEEQALARIHRLSQKKEVITVRFYIKDTFEEVSHEYTPKEASEKLMTFEARDGTSAIKRRVGRHAFLMGKRTVWKCYAFRGECSQWNNQFR